MASLFSIAPSNNESFVSVCVSGGCNDGRPSCPSTSPWAGDVRHDDANARPGWCGHIRRSQYVQYLVWIVVIHPVYLVSTVVSHSAGQKSIYFSNVQCGEQPWNSCSWTEWHVFPHLGISLVYLRGTSQIFPRSKLKLYHFVPMYPYIVSLILFWLCELYAILAPPRFEPLSLETGCCGTYIYIILIYNRAFWVA